MTKISIEEKDSLFREIYKIKGRNEKGGKYGETEDKSEQRFPLSQTDPIIIRGK